VITVIAGVVALVASASLARPLGRALTPKGLWALIVAGVVIVIAATALAWWGLAVGGDVWWGIALGLGFGGLSGLRYGHGTLFDVLLRRPGAADEVRR
jgi:hypothetical protein